LELSWEHNRNSGYYKALKKSIDSTEILVVIGYSFPFFNREIDRLLLKESMPNLKKVYFQAPDCEILKERFLAIRDDISDLVLRRDKDQFVFPNEL
jgi:hypothetical protein